jgi:hypothetical protein
LTVLTIGFLPDVPLYYTWGLTLKHRVVVSFFDPVPSAQLQWDVAGAKLTKYITRTVIDRGLQAVKQALDDMPAPQTAEDRAVWTECREMLLGYREQFRADRDRLTGIADTSAAYLIDDPDVT